jgi:Leucine-rich repeat (LRR) protein
MLLKFISFVLFLQFINSQEIFEVRLPCEFQNFQVYDYNNYACVVRNFTFNFSNPFYYVIIEGQHEANRNNSDVLNVVFEDSEINRLPSNLFQLFPNMVAIQATNGSVTAITPMDFIFAPAIEAVVVTNNDIRNLTGSPFWGRPRVVHLNLYSNNIEFIAQGFFTGLVNLRYLSLGGNQLTSLAPQIFAPLAGLRTLLASFNQIASLSPQMFSTNRQLEIVAFEFNNINALGEGIFDNLPSLEFIGLLGNECVNEEFELGETRTVEDVNEVLVPCFESFVPEPPRRRQLVFELRGNMTLNNDDGSEIANVIGRSV